MPITQDNAISILSLLEDWRGAHSTRSQQDDDLSQDSSSGYTVLTRLSTSDNAACSH